jgi:hypothetical protein
MTLFWRSTMCHVFNIHNGLCVGAFVCKQSHCVNIVMAGEVESQPLSLGSVRSCIAYCLHALFETKAPYTLTHLKSKPSFLLCLCSLLANCHFKNLSMACFVTWLYVLQFGLRGDLQAYNSLVTRYDSTSFSPSLSPSLSLMEFLRIQIQSLTGCSHSCW